MEQLQPLVQLQTKRFNLVKELLLLIHLLNHLSLVNRQVVEAPGRVDQGHQEEISMQP